MRPTKLESDRWVDGGPACHSPRAASSRSSLRDWPCPPESCPLPSPRSQQRTCSSQSWRARSWRECRMPRGSAHGERTTPDPRRAVVVNNTEEAPLLRHPTAHCVHHFLLPPTAGYRRVARWLKYTRGEPLRSEASVHYPIPLQ